VTPTPPFVLIGMMGSGKSTVGPLLASRLGWRFADSDALVEKRAGKPTSQIFADYGESHFRDLERRAMVELLAQDETVIAAGGGWAAADEAWNTLPAGVRTVWLRAASEALLGRLRAEVERGPRPLLAEGDLEGSVERMLKDRTRFYARADLVVDTDDMQPADVAGRLQVLLKELL